MSLQAKCEKPALVTALPISGAKLCRQPISCVSTYDESNLGVKFSLVLEQCTDAGFDQSNKLTHTTAWLVIAAKKS